MIRNQSVFKCSADNFGAELPDGTQIQYEILHYAYSEASHLSYTLWL